MLVVDFPQGEDLQTNYAISGYKANMIQEFCRHAGVNWNDLWRTSLIKERVPDIIGGKKKGKKKETEADTAKLLLEELVPRYKDVLLNEISELKPNLIVPLGETSFQFLSGLVGLRKFRGSILKLNPLLGIERYTKLLPTLGPYPYLYTDFKQKFITQLDFQKIPKWSGEQPIPDDTYQIWTARTNTALSNFLNRAIPICLSKTLEEGGFLNFDIETHMNVPTCISFCFDGFESVCIPFIDKEIPFEQRALMMKQVADVLADPRIPKVNQNIKYDWKTQERWKFKVANVVGDTMLGASVLYCEFPKNLGFLTSIYTDLPYFKDEGKEWDPERFQKDRFYGYNAKDSLSCHQIYQKQLGEFKELGVDSVYENTIKLVPIYRRMEDRGLLVDEAQREKLLAKYESLFRQHTKVLQSILNEDTVNVLSSQQMIRVVFETLGYRKIRGVSGSDEDSLNMLLCFGVPERCTVDNGKAVLREIQWCRKIHKVIEILELDIYPDGRFRTEGKLGGTETGRTSFGVTTDYFLKEEWKGKKQKVVKKNLGHSFQTIGKHGFWIEGEIYGKDIRSMYVCSPGYSFVEIDLSGAEARVDRVLSGNFDLSVFDHPGIHKLTGSWLFDCQPVNIKKETHEYHLAKTFRHAGERNMGANRAFMMCQDEGIGLSLSLKDATKLLDKFHEKSPEMRQVYHRDIETCLNATRSLIAPNGRRRDFFDRIDHGTINEGISQLPQAIVSDQTKFSFIPTSQEAPWAEPLMEAHDGSMWEVPTERIEEFAKIYVRNIETPIDFRNGSLKRDYQLTIPAECSVSHTSWQELKGFEL